MPPLAESCLRIPSDAGHLDALLGLPDGASLGCVVAHPHPLYGGNMRNPVVAATVAALQEAAVATLRFDFRGVGRSDGVHAGGDGEVEDLRAAVAALAACPGIRETAVAGYSFGAWMALRLAGRDGDLRAVAAIAPPLAMTDTSGIGPLAMPLLVVAGDRDSYCPRADLDAFVASRPGTRTCLLGGADHFLVGREAEVGAAVAAFVARPPSRADS
jgi:alpha/beta superfamily hydrolase